ncbi:MAG: DUF4442 domain-containing protein [Myxococcales bacterium]|nr:DUF4442 domain-containing protein [Myxococcales bacterium]
MLKHLKETVYLRAYATAKIPMIAWTRPTVVHLDDERCEIRIKLSRRTRNHLKSMYFGVLCVGADVAGGMLAMQFIRTQPVKIALVFKDFQADFLKRPDGHVHFHCRDGAALQALVAEAVATGERKSLPMTIQAVVPDKGDELVANMTLTISMKVKKPAA